MVEFSKKEIKHISIASLVLALVFGFDDKAPTFVFVHWLSNYFYVLILVLIALLVHEYAHKLVAKKYNYTTEYSLWFIKRYSFERKALSAKNIPIGIILALFFIFFSATLSKGLLLIPFAAVGTFTLKRLKVLGKNLQAAASEETRISLAGPLTNLALAIIFLPFQTFSFINAVLAVYDLLPLPNLDGSKIFFKSRIVFMLVFVFALLVVLVLQLHLGLLELFIALVVALAIAVIFVINYLYFFHFR